MFTIYKYTQLSTGKVYIGQTQDLHKRHLHHLTGSMPVDFLLRSIPLDFTLNTIETTRDPDNREKFWIFVYNAVKEGFNRSNGWGRILEPERAAKLRLVREHAPYAFPAVAYAESHKIITYDKLRELKVSPKDFWVKNYFNQITARKFELLDDFAMNLVKIDRNKYRQLISAAKIF